MKGTDDMETWELDERTGDIACITCRRAFRSWAWDVCPHCDIDSATGDALCADCHRRWRTSEWTKCPHCRRRAHARECVEEWLRFKLAGMPVRSTEVH